MKEGFKSQCRALLVLNNVKCILNNEITNQG